MMMTMKLVAAAFLALVIASGVEGFASFQTGVLPSTKSTSLTMNHHRNSNINNHQGIQSAAAASLVAATLLFGNIAAAGPAIAAVSLDDNDNMLPDFSTHLMIAARSGGRAGGRSAGARAAPRPSSSSSTTTNTRIIERTRYVPSYSSPSVILAPPPVYYNPLPGYGLGLGLNAINQIGNDMRDYRQENEIRDARTQLEQSKMREAEMEARLRVLEQGQVNQQQLTNQQLMMLQQQQQLKQ
jgi:hypothetical protein